MEVVSRGSPCPAQVIHNYWQYWKTKFPWGPKTIRGKWENPFSRKCTLSTFGQEKTGMWYYHREIAIYLVGHQKSFRPDGNNQGNCCFPVGSHLGKSKFQNKNKKCTFPCFDEHCISKYIHIPPNLQGHPICFIYVTNYNSNKLIYCLYSYNQANNGWRCTSWCSVKQIMTVVTKLGPELMFI
jgi:hypothetical protein